MRSILGFFASVIGLPLAIFSGISALAIGFAPTFWERVMLHHGATSEWALHTPIWLPISTFVAGISAVVWASKNAEGLTPTAKSTSHGSARNSTTAEIHKKGHGSVSKTTRDIEGVVACMESEAQLTECVKPSGALYWEVNKPAPFVRIRRMHTLVEGPNGAGKDACVVLPTLLTDVTHSYVVNDPKGETYRLTAGYRSAFTTILRFAPCDENTDRCNPLLAIPLGTSRQVTEAKRIANVLVGSTAREEMSSRIYLKSCETLLTCAILHVMHRAPKAKRNLPGVLSLLTNPRQNEEKIADAICDNPPPGTEDAMNNLRRLSQDGRMLQGAFTTALDVLDFCMLPQVAYAISGDDFRANDISQRETPVTLYLEFPFRDADILRPLARLMLDNLLSHHSFERKHDTTYLLNELYSMGNITALLRGIGEIREYGVQLVLFVQSESQLFSSYGKDEAITILDNCRARITLGVSGQEAAERVSDRLGKATLVRPRKTQAVSSKGLLESTVTNTKGEGEQARELMTPDEVRALLADSVLVDLPDLHIYRGKRAPVYALPELDRRSRFPAPTQKSRLRSVV
jgi:type IV secretion system protein VirD4